MNENSVNKKEQIPSIVVNAVTTSSRHKSARTRVPQSPKKLSSPESSAGGEGKVLKSDSEGIFWFQEPCTEIVDGKRVHKGISSRERQQLKELVKSNFFKEGTEQSVLTIKKIVELNDESSQAPRLRAYDWAVTNYAKGHPKSMLLQKSGERATIIDPNLSYEGELRKHHRLLFDPFRRGTHIFFEMDGLIHRTTTGQLTFIKWCIENGVDQYVEENLADIRQHMSEASKRKQQILLSETGEVMKKRRMELTRAPTKLVRGVLLTSYEIMTDTAKEIEASINANSKSKPQEI